MEETFLMKSLAQPIINPVTIAKNWDIFRACCCRNKPQIKENHRPLNTVITTPAISERFESYSETSDNDEYLFAVKKLFVEQDKKLSKFEVNVNLES